MNPVAGFWLRYRCACGELSAHVDNAHTGRRAQAGWLDPAARRCVGVSGKFWRCETCWRADAVLRAAGAGGLA